MDITFKILKTENHPNEIIYIYIYVQNNNNKYSLNIKMENMIMKAFKIFHHKSDL